LEAHYIKLAQDRYSSIHWWICQFHCSWTMCVHRCFSFKQGSFVFALNIQDPGYIERKLDIKESKALTYASKAYICRNLKAVSIIPCQSKLSVLLINWIYDIWSEVLLYQKNVW
jgi:hypothetical protein